MPKVKLSAAQRDELQSLVNKEFQDLYDWFSCEREHQRFGNSAIPLVDRAELLGVPYSVMNLVDDRLQDLSDLMQTLGE